MKTGTDTYIQWKWEHYDQYVIKSYSSYIYHTPARLTASPLPFSNFYIPPFLGIFGKVNPPFKKGWGVGGGVGWVRTMYLQMWRRKEGKKFRKTYIPFCQNELKMLSLIGDLPVSHKSLILEPWKMSNC